MCHFGTELPQKLIFIARLSSKSAIKHTLIEPNEPTTMSSSQLITVMSTAVVKSLTSSLPAAVNTKYNIDPADFTNFLGDFLKEQLKSGTGKKGRKNLGRVSGYNLFSQHLHQQDKANGFKEAGEQWKAMTDAQRAAWNEKAARMNSERPAPVVAEPQQPQQKKKRVGHVSGYNLFLKHRRSQDKSIEMKTIGEQWKALSDAEKAEWNAKAASTQPASAAAAPPALEEEDSEATQPIARPVLRVREDSDSDATQPMTQPALARSFARPVEQESLPMSPLQVTQSQMTQPAGPVSQYESANEEERPIKKEPVEEEAAKKKKPAKKSAPKKQPVEGSIDNVTSDEKDKPHVPVKRDPATGKFMVQGTTMFVKNHKNHTVVGKMVDGQEQPLGYVERMLCQQRGWPCVNN